jgi:CheY-specific phosphatase CheX
VKAVFEVQSTAHVLESEPLRDAEVDFGVDPLLLKAVVRGMRVGLQMTRATVSPIGASRLTTARHAITVMVGLVGVHSGNIALNLSESAAKHLASGLLGSTVTEINEDCVDAIMEIGNMVAGGIKTALAETGYAMANISLPSLVLGQSYSMAYARGISAVCVEFELTDLSFSAMDARYVSTALSLLRGTGA